MTAKACDRAVLFLLEAGERVGLGHWFRCLALMHELQRGHPTIEAISMTNPLAPELKRSLEHNRIRSVERLARPANQVLDIAEQFGSKCIVLDILDTDPAFIAALGAALRVISIGGSGSGRDHVHVRIDGMLERPGFSDGFRGERLFAGPDYVILRKPFQDCQPITVRDRITNVLVALGGDAQGHGRIVAGMIGHLDSSVRIRVILGALARRTDEPPPDQTELYYDVADPIPLMRESDLAITSGGMTTYELLRMGIPTLIVAAVEGQVKPALAFEERGVAKYIGRVNEGNTSLLCNLGAACRLLASPKERQLLSDKGRALVDGRGLQRVASLVREEVMERMVP